MPDPTTPEILTGVTASTAHVVTVTTSLVPSDLVVVIVPTLGNALYNITPSGLGTWSAELTGMSGGTNRYGVRVFTLTGVTGGGNITLSQGTLNTASYVVFVVRDLEVPAVDGMSFEFITNSAQVASEHLVRARDKSLAVSIVHAMGGTVVNPATGTSPAPGGWTSDRTGTGSGALNVSHIIVGSGAGQVLDVFTTYGAYSLDFAVGLIVFGTPLEDRLQKAGVDALTTAAAAPRALEAEQVEALTTSAAAPRALSEENVEVLSNAKPPRNILAAPVEALTTSAAAARAVEAAGVEVLADPGSRRLLRAEQVEVLASWVIATPSNLFAEQVEVLAELVYDVGRAVAAEQVEALTAARESILAAEYVEVLRVAALSTSTPRLPVWGIALY